MTIINREMVDMKITRIKDEAIDILRDEYNHKEKYDGQWEYQWLMGISMKLEKSGTSTMRVVVKTSESPYVDGMDIEFMIIDGYLEMHPLFYEEGPDLMGSPELDSIKWLSKLGEIFYLQVENPYKNENRDIEDNENDI